MCNLFLIIGLFLSMCFNGFLAVRCSQLDQQARFARRLAQELLDRLNYQKPRRDKRGRFMKKGAVG